MTLASNPDLPVTDHPTTPVALCLDASSRSVTLRGTSIVLTAKEFALLVLLADDPSRVQTKEAILRKVWGTASPATTRTLDSTAVRLRVKLQRDGDRFVINVWGVGYRLADTALTVTSAGAGTR